MKIGWFGSNEHRVFNYRPRYYDQEQENRRQKFGHVDGTYDKQVETKQYVPGSIIYGALRDGNYAKRKGGSNAVVIVSIVGMILFAVILVLMTKLYALL